MFLGDNLEMRTPPNDLRPYVYLEIHRRAKRREIGVEPTRERRIQFTPLPVPEFMGANEVPGADFGPDTPDKWLL
jgi:hypothetical protein